MVSPWDGELLSGNHTESSDDDKKKRLSSDSSSLHLKDEGSDYLDTSVLEDMIRQYSQFIDFPIYLWKSKIVSEMVPDDQSRARDLFGLSSAS